MGDFVGYVVRDMVADFATLDTSGNWLDELVFHCRIVLQ